MPSPRRIEQDAVATRDRWEGLDAAVAALRVDGASGEVEVTVDSGGALVDVRFSERFRAVEAATLSASVLRALQIAQALLPDRVTALVGGGPTADAVVAGYRRRFPPAAEPEPPPSPYTWLR